MFHQPVCFTQTLGIGGLSRAHRQCAQLHPRHAAEQRQRVHRRRRRRRRLRQQEIAYPGRHLRVVPERRVARVALHRQGSGGGDPQRRRVPAQWRNRSRPCRQLQAPRTRRSVRSRRSPSRALLCALPRHRPLLAPTSWWKSAGLHPIGNLFPMANKRLDNLRTAGHMPNTQAGNSETFSMQGVKYV